MIGFTLPTEKFNALRKGCLNFQIQSNCDLDCEFQYCFPAMARPSEGRSVNEEENQFLSFQVVPNPVSDMLSIKYGLTQGQQENTGIEICNVLGQTVFRRYDSTAQVNLQIDVSEWQAGLYFVNLVAGSKKIAVKKVVKQ
jgi:hypothetical protein